MCGFGSHGYIIILTTEGPDGEIAHWKRLDYGQEFVDDDNERYVEVEIPSAAPFRTQLS